MTRIILNTKDPQEFAKLTAAQMEMWFSQKLEPGNPLFDSRGYLEISGAIDRTAFEAALSRVIQDARSLHLRFVETPTGPMQFECAPASSGLDFIDVSNEADPFSACWNIMQIESNTAYDLLSGKLFSQMLFKLGDERHIWYQRYHHIVMDGASIPLVTRRVAQIYTALMRRQPVPDAGFGAIDLMTDGDRSYRSSSRYANDRRYWQDYADTLPAPETLAGKTPHASGFFRRESTPLPLAFTAQLDRIETQIGKWPLVLTAIVAAYLYRTSNGRITVFDFPVSARTKETRTLPGMFANILPMRLPMTPQMSLVELTRHVSTEVFSHMKHQQFRVKEIKQLRGAVTAPVFGPRINIVPFDNRWEFGESRATLHALANGLVNDFAVTVTGDPRDPGCTLHVDGNAELYDAASVQAHRTRLLHFIETALAHPDQPIGQIDLLDADERRLLLQTWNATDAAYPAHRCIHELVEAQARQTPEAVAIVADHEQLSYAALNARANRLAHYLVELGVGPDTPVAVCAERSIAMVVALLAVFKAGGAYLSIDPAYSGARLAHILDDAAPAVVLVDPVGRQALADLPSATSTLVDIGFASPSWASRSADNLLPLARGLTSRHLAYVIYTSGSTGTPKGVMVEHRQLANLVTWHITRFGLHAGSRVPATASLAFDASVWEIWPALCAGAALLLPPAGLASDAAALLAWWRRQSMDCAFLVTPLALLAMQSGLPHGLKSLLIGGDRVTTLPAGLPPSLRIVNNYGPTETTVVATSGELVPSSGDVVHSIGKPIANTRIYLLDDAQAPVPMGTVGELYIGGAGVARGYLNRPELTAQRFLPDPFARAAGESEARMYRTGDLARYLPDGNIVFLGRNDDQVKIRGFRIEPGEIEAHLAMHDAVREAIVLARPDAAGNARLLAYVTLDDAAPRAEHAELVRQLREHLAARLPDYMVPAAFVVLDALPLTSNGKLDRRALPAPDDDAFAQAQYEAPQGEIERTVAALWSELLGIERIGRHDNFFALGGHSLIAVQLIERLRQIGLTLAIRDLFEQPALAALSATLGQSREVVVPENRLGPDTQAITPDLLPLADLSQDDIDRIVTQVPGGIANIQDIYALSPLQDGILFHHVLSTQGDPYLLSAHLAFADRAALDRYLQAMDCLVERHDTLRTAVLWEGLGSPVQVVLRRAHLDVTELAPDDGACAAEQLPDHIHPGRYRMDLTQAPLLRFVIAEATEGRWHAMMLLHHLVGDHSTLAILNEEVQATLAGQLHRLPAPQPYRNLVAHARLGMPASAHEAFFSEMLNDVDAPTLPFGLTLQHDDMAPVYDARRTMPGTLDARLRTLSKTVGVSLATLCHLAWALVLARTSGQRRVVFGTVLFGRMAAGAGADRTMGLYINTLPLRIDIDATDICTAVRDAQKRLAGLLAHEHASLALAQRCSGVGANAPLFSALLNYRHNVHNDGQAQWPSDVELLGAHERTNYPVTLSVEDDGDALELVAQVVSPTLPEQICAYMQRALEQLADALEAGSGSLERLQVVPDDERALLVDTLNATDAPYDRHQYLHGLFEAQVRRTPEATALISGGEHLSYAELNARANRLARYLIEFDVAPDTPVAVCLDRGTPMVVALLGILKAGGAYVPLDPAYPGARLAHILSDAAPAVVLVDPVGRQALADALGDTHLAKHTLVDVSVASPPWDGLAADDLSPHTLGLTPRHLAYVIYTSGSTGLPKGVQNEHDALINRLTWMQAAYHLDARDVVLQKTPFSFDVSVWEFFWPLANGATLVMAAPGAHRDADYLTDVIAQYAVTTLHFVPSMLSGFLEAPGLARCTTLSRIICSGEALPVATARRCLERLPHAQLHNLYGPTEAAIDVTAFTCPVDFDAPSVPIGKPIANTRIYLLDDAQAPVPLGAVGELYIGGVGVARGYLNRPELNAQRFLPDPFARAAGDPEARMYRTGDLARYLPDGNIVFLGRNDDQVKIRGFRIELGEIEAQLALHDAVREAIVLARPDAAGTTRLLAYVTLDDAAPRAELARQLREHLAARLPDYMVPAAFVVLDTLPLTPNGKLDRRALPEPDDDAFAHTQYEAPQGEIECAIAALWAELLGIERVGRHDNFFALGGHSLVAIRMVSRIVNETGKALPLRKVFEAPTVAELALALADATSHESGHDIVRIDRHAPMPLSFAEERILAIEAGAARGAMFNSSRLFILSGQMREDVLDRALRAVVDRHEILRTHYASDAATGAFVPVVERADSFRLERRDVAGDDAMSLAQAEAAKLLDCFEGPVFGATLFVESPQRSILMISIHHIAMDATSWTTVWRDFRHAYAALAADAPPALAPLALQYRDYAAWSKRHVDVEHLAQLEQVWRERLAGAPACVDLPSDRPRPVRLSDRAGRCEHVLAPELVQQIRQVAAACNVTPFVVLETALAITCAQLARSRDIVIGTVTEGRTHAATEEMVGLFVNTLPLRHRLDRSASVASHLLAASRELLSALEAGELPFAHLVAAVNPPRSTSYDPIFQVFCQFQQGPGTERETISGLTLEAVPRARVGRGADLAVVFLDTGETVSADVSYSADLFDPASIDAIVALFLAFVTESVQRPDASVTDRWDAGVARMRADTSGPDVARLIDTPASPSGTWYPLSPAQQAVWLQEQASPHGTSFFSIAAMRCAPEIDRERLVIASRALIAQNQSFWLQLSDAGLQSEGPMPTTRFEHFVESATRTDAEMRQAVVDWHETLNDNLDDKTNSVAIFESPGSVLVALRSHHLQTDGWAAVRLFERIGKNYAALEKDPAHAFDMDRFVLDTLALDDRYPCSSTYERDATFWQSACTKMDGPALVTLVADRAHPVDARGVVASMRRTFSPALQARLAHTAQKHALSPSECLTALTSIYLMRIAGQRRAVVGASFLNRTREALDIPGQFAKVIPLPVSLEQADAPVSAALGEICGMFRNVMRHGRFPLGDMVRRYGIDPRHIDVSVNTLFLRHPVEVAGQPTHVQWLSGPENGLSFLFTQFGRNAPIDVELRYNRNVFDPAAVSRHAARLLDFIERACEDDSVAAWSIDLVSSDEKALLVDTLNATDAPYDRHQYLHGLFEAQARRTPAATALISGGERLSYAELNARANRLARYLIEFDVTPDTPVAVCLDRGTPMVVALLGILKAGGAYVPLDPAYPGARLAHILSDSAPAVVLVDPVGRQALADALGDTHLAKHTLVDVSVASPPWDGLPADDLSPHALGLTPRHLAYVIYTSGSTGLPKGVQNEHDALINRLTWMQSAYHLDARDVVLQKTPFSFDVSVWEFFWPLANGATLVMAAPGAHRDADYLTDVISQHAVTTLHFVPSMLSGFLEAPGLARCTTLSRIICSGEALPVATARRCLERLPHAQLHNLYGPTEAAIDVTAFTCPAGFDAPSVPIGKPIANTRIYLLDDAQAPVPLGAVGELYIGGVGVARGYLNRPELNAQRFVADPFARAAGAPEARMYRTGDLARYLPDGNIVFLGRNDDQVKIRGFRIELGEIEAQLALHDVVREAIVLARPDAAGTTRLLAYVTLDDAATRAELARQLREHLAARLPDYMVPAAFVVLDTLPLTPNGKLDRRALPEPDDDAFVHTQYEAPQGEIECAIAALWAELLGIERVGRHDNFFALGGHSLLAVRMLNRLRAMHEVRLSLSSLFDHPTVCAVAQVVGARHRDDAPAIARIDRDAPLPLSFAQQRMMFLSGFEGAGTIYHVPLVLRLDGRLDADAWHRALDALWARHESLRTVFPETAGASGDTRAALLPAGDGMPWREDDLSSEPGAPEHGLRLCEEEATRPFDLARGPLVRARLVRLSEHAHVFMLTLHHIVCDGWSLTVLVKELGALYEAFTAGRPNPLATLAFQYPDYVAWQQQWLGAERLEREAGYWKQALAGIPTLLTLPTDRPRPAHQQFDAARLPLELDAVLTRDLRRFAARRGVTVFAVVTAAWAAVLGRLAGQEDVVIGTPVANRSGPEFESIVGLFVNTLALRIDLSGVPSVAQLLDRVQEAVVAAQDHQDLPFEQVVEIVKPPRRLGHTSIFQVMISWQNTDVRTIEVPDLDITPVASAFDRAKFDLELDLVDDGRAVAGALRYATALFDETSIARHGAYLIAVLRAMTRDEAQPIGQIDLLDADERQLLLQTWNATDAAYPAHQCIHELVEAQARQTPEAVAIVAEHEQLSYAALNARANRLAHYLVELGVGPDTPVAVCAERSIAMVVALLAVFKAGGAYLSIDPAYSGARLAHILDDAAPAVVLVDPVGRQALADLPLATSTPTPTLVDIGFASPSWASRSADNLLPLARGLTSRNLAYVIYTSGSTGTPKGVMVEHRQLANLVTWHIARFDLHAGSRVPATASLAFDASVWEIWPALCAGAALLLPPAGLASDAAALLAWWRRQSMDCAFLVTPLALLAMQSGLPPGLKSLLIGGDRVTTLPAGLPPSLRIVNNYGPTETTVVATSGELVPSSGDVVHSIGKPIANTRIYLLDDAQAPVPLGAVGELYIGGAGVARGYLNRPELTEQRFLPDPFARAAGQPEARMYRTGDLARYLPDGNIVFLGRNDDQVKIRGFRIEPGEIEAHLAMHDAVREAIVLARPDAAGNARLLAYVTLDDAAPRAELGRRLREHLVSRLPEYMVPAAFIVLDALPLTSNGKLDRRALPEPDDDAFAHTQYEAPQGETERTVAALWAELLGVERVGRHDNFFALGGHSLIAVRLLVQIRETFGHEISIRTLFESPTVAQLAPRIHETGASDALAVLLPLQPQGARSPLFCIHPAGGFSWPYASLTHHLRDRPLYGLQARALTEAGQSVQSIEDMAQDYVRQIRGVQRAGPYHLLGWSLGCHIAHAIATQLQRAGEKVAFLAMLDGYPEVRSDAYPAPTETEVIDVLIRAFVDTPQVADDRSLTIDTLRTRLAEHNPMFRTFNERTFESIVRQFQVAPTQASRFAPDVFHGDVVFFRAALDRPEAGQPRDVRAWQPYVRGKIDVHDIACLHETMMSPSALAGIGPIVAAALDAGATHGKALSDAPISVTGAWPRHGETIGGVSDGSLS
ncbi:amino acid adenylation domain-containing protein [Burkholderia lata]|uniref:amino acid adenylation domain-containing protein n=1 Tax=Burkholderia lata (strain ATCC 17760 / DSM 23089 / LMG 22485 / NCIMB 9086 / R18194 / 383) TaxID=482957 RepID=UPI00266F6562|nr:non-ribosomal peptide synthetase [Burkholderia lata]